MDRFPIDKPESNNNIIKHDCAQSNKTDIQSKLARFNTEQKSVTTTIDQIDNKLFLFYNKTSINIYKIIDIETTIANLKVYYERMLGINTKSWWVNRDRTTIEYNEAF
jgi:archaellum component FlaC